MKIEVMKECSHAPETTKHYEGVFSQGSGYLHIRGTYEEGLKAASQNDRYMRLPANVTIEKPRHLRSKCGTYIPGIMGNHPLLKEEIINLPNPLIFKVREHGEDLDMDTCRISHYERVLDMETAVLRRGFLWHAASGTQIWCRYQRYLPRQLRNVIVQEIEYVVESGEGILTFDSDIDTDVTTNGYCHFLDVRKEKEICRTQVEVTTDKEEQVRMVSVVMQYDGKDVRRDYEDFPNVYLKQGQKVQLLKITGFSTSRDTEGLLEFREIEHAVRKAGENCKQVRKEHELLWRRMWMDSRVSIEGDQKAQQAVDFSVYHLLRCANDGEERTAICAKGFAGEAYFGHFFWDTEIYMLPFYLYTRPHTARSLEMFRVHSLPGALQNAENYGYRGAKYAWESGISGEEQCPNWQYADHEIHISADVALGIWHYYTATEDLEFLRCAIPVLTETSEFWLDRIWKDEKGIGHIHGVMGPDEYICFCNDNAYTNVMAACAMKITRKALETVFEKIPREYRELYGRLSQMDGKMCVLRDESGRILQCKGFDELEEPQFEKFWKDRSRPFGQFVSQERNYRIKALKQADVLMLFYLFEQGMEEEDLEKNFAYYFPYTTHDSSLSSIVHAILCSRMGKKEEAYQLFCHALDIDTDENKAGAAEGIHIANSGGIWQGIVMGFAGMKWSYESEGLKFAPKLPKHWEKLEFRIWYRNIQYQVIITQEEVEINEIARKHGK